MDECLEHKFKQLGIQFLHFPQELNSTNTYALNTKFKLIQLPALISCVEQTAGRGRGQNKWSSSIGSLPFSLVTTLAKLKVKEVDVHFIPLLMGYSIQKVLQRLLPAEPVQIKWPNDILVEGKKIAGILVERRVDDPEQLIIGVGINNQNDLPVAFKDLKIVPCSLKSYDVTISSNELLLSIVEQFFLDLQAYTFDEIIEDINMCLYKKNELVTHVNLNVKTSGICLGLDPKGALQIQTEYSVESFVGGSLSYG